MIKLSLYDFDRTIYSKDTGVEILFNIAKTKARFWKYIPKMFMAVFCYIFRLYSVDKMKECIFSSLSLFTKEEWQIFITEFWQKEQNNLFPDVIQQIKEDRKNGYTIGVLTASYDIFITPLQSLLEVDFIIGTQIADGDIIDPTIKGYNCKKAEKVVRLIEYINHNYPKQYVEISKMYSDSLHDLPLFRIAKETFAVDPKGKISEGLPSPNKNL